MQEEQQKVLEMLAAGKITAEEANRLLAALEGEPLNEGGNTPREAATEQEGVASHTPVRDPSLLERILAMVGGGAKYKETLDQELDASGVSLINVETSNGAIRYNGGTQDRVIVHVRKVVSGPTEEAARAFAQQVQVHVKREGNVIRIYKEHPRPPWGTRVSVSYEIEGPAAVDVQMHTSNGKIEIGHVTGTVEAMTSNGKVELLEVSGRVTAHTSNGAIEARLKALQDQGEFATSNGAVNVVIQQGSAPIAATTSNGAIGITVLQDAMPITATTSNGAITVTLPADFAGKLDAATTNGRVQADFSLNVITRGKDHLVGQIGEGGDAIVKLRTANGGIQIHQAQ